MAIRAVVQELKWLTYLLNEMKVKVKLPITLFFDNQAAVSISENDVHHHAPSISILHIIIYETRSETSLCTSGGYNRLIS